MTTVGFDIDPTQLILSEINSIARSSSHKNLPLKTPSFFQVQYLQKKILKMNAQEASQYQKSLQQQNMKQYLEQTNKDRIKYEQIKHDLKHKYFRIKSKKPSIIKNPTMQKQPIDMIKQYSQLNTSRNSLSELSNPQTKMSSSLMLSSHRDSLKTRYANQLQHFLQSSEKMTRKKSHYKLQGGTTSQKNKKHENMMKQQRQQILSIIKARNYSVERPDNIDQISNIERYSLGYLDYLKTKTKMGLDHDLFQKKVKKINGKMEHFQEFILRQVKLKKQTRGQLQNFYIKIRDQFKRIQKNKSPKIT